MAELLKQLKIKTSMLIRLKKEYSSYEKEAKGIDNKLEQLSNQYEVEKTEDVEIEIKKNVQHKLW